MESNAPELKIVEVEINHSCNMACSYCPNSYAERVEKGHMSEDLFNSLLDQLKEMSFSGRLSFSFYNEPLLSPNLSHFVDLANRKLNDVELLLYTNGSLLDESTFFDLVEKGVDQFVVTQHSEGQRFDFGSVYQKYSHDPVMEKVQLQLTSDLKLTNRGGVVESVPNHVPALSPCELPMFMAIVTLEGNVLPCFEDFYQSNTMGNISETDLQSIWASERFQSFRRDLKKGLRHLHSACKNCSRVEALSPK